MNLLALSHTDEAALPARTVTRWKNGGPVRTVGVVPKKIDRHRIREALREVKMFWEEIAEILSDEEIAYLDHLFHHNKKFRTWMDVVFSIHKGEIE